ncbi:hypothetical protein V6R21_11930 [Limibacter armeniacum]|uniref:hypothetical protein n=1 Tax=Limibacter armeniacum TaxID=466084 RepID=UPI002FE693EA
MFKKAYPNLAWWVENQGWIEIGEDLQSDSWIRILDEGGMCWEDEGSSSLDEALLEADKWLAEEIEDRFKKVPPKKY